MKWASLVLLLLLELLISASSAETDGGWNWINDLKHMNGSEFKQSINPIVQMAANAYRYPSIIEIPGWSLTPLVPPVAPPEGGVHVLAYQQPPNNIIIAFRGTQITEKQDGLADQCADMILWDGKEFESLPPECSIFTYSTLDYFSQALNFTKKVMEAYPGHPILLTGHSLGAGLAVLVSAALSDNDDDGPVVPVIGFGPPGTKEAMEKRFLHLRAAEEGKVFLVANQWDEITRTQWDEQVGILCLYQTEEPEACKACFDSLAFSTRHGHGHSRLLLEETGGEQWSESSCTTCFIKTHVLKNLIKLVNEGSKPVCEEIDPIIKAFESGLD
uniref:Fungal lipase-type domain-containing protein n=1 Tax=Araucaria cunninghamii TaxID=56994 RepID=A0A0D6R2H9_ARACU